MMENREGATEVGVFGYESPSKPPFWLYIFFSFNLVLLFSTKIQPNYPKINGNT